jgi:succinate-semialdehyde dehydrogenase/glutarate-semialdehyde dehydrogenase
MQLSDSTLLKQAALIGGEWLSASSRDALSVNDPASGAVVGAVPDCTADDTLEAIRRHAHGPRGAPARRANAAPCWKRGMRWCWPIWTIWR